MTDDDAVSLAHDLISAHADLQIRLLESEALTPNWPGCSSVLNGAVAAKNTLKSVRCAFLPDGGTERRPTITKGANYSPSSRKPPLSEARRA